jgi:hypothetical protein
MRSPPAALGAPSVGFMLNALDRWTYASGTSPATVLSLPVPLPQPARASAAAIPASTQVRVTRRGLAMGWTVGVDRSFI